MDKSKSSLPTKSSERNALPPGVAPDLEEILDLCAQLQDEVPNHSKAEKLISKIATIANNAAATILADLEESEAA